MIFLDEERFLAEAVRSVLDQTLADWELILVDDGSGDGSSVIARECASADARIRYVEHPGHVNRGMSASRNVGVAHSTGRYVAFLDADDVWVPEKLAEQVEILENEPDVAAVFGAVRYWSSWDPASSTADQVILTGGVADRRIDPPDAAMSIYPLGAGGGASPSDVLVRASAFNAVGGFEERFRGLYEDQAFFIKLFLRYPIYITAREWLHYRLHDNSECAQTTRKRYWRIRLAFLDWMREDPHRLADPRVRAAVVLARRKAVVQGAVAPVVDIRRRMLSVIPVEYKDRVKRLAGHR